MAYGNVEYLVQKYSEIESIYGEIEPNKFHQKYLYIIFLDKHAHFSNIKDSIKFLERTLLEYKKGESNNSPARKLIQKGFKELLKEEIRKNNL